MHQSKEYIFCNDPVCEAEACATDLEKALGKLERAISDIQYFVDRCTKPHPDGPISSIRTLEKFRTTLEVINDG